MKNISVITLALLTGCASFGMESNTQNFLGQIYKISQADLGNSVSTFYFDNQQNTNQRIVVERNIKHPKDVSGKVFEQDWMQKEQQHRSQDCKITQKQTAKTNYYTCQFTHTPAVAIYTFKTDANNVYAKMWVVKDLNNPLSLSNEQKIADELADFYLP